MIILPNMSNVMGSGVGAFAGSRPLRAGEKGGQAGMDLRIALSSVCVPGVSVASTRVKMPMGSPAPWWRSAGRLARHGEDRLYRPGRDKPDIVKIHRQLARQGGGEGLDAAGGHLTATALEQRFGVLPRHGAFR